MVSSSDPTPTQWDKTDLEGLPGADSYYTGLLEYVPDDGLSPYNPTPGTGKTGMYYIPPNNYPFYEEDEKYKPKMQSDGGQWSDTRAMYSASPAEQEEHRRIAYETGIPHGYKADAVKEDPNEPKLRLTVSSRYFKPDEFGPKVRPDGMHEGGSFVIEVPASIRVDDLRLVIQAKGGVPVALQKLGYGGKKLMDPNRTLKQYGVAYWHRKFPHWEIKLLAV